MVLRSKDVLGLEDLSAYDPCLVMQQYGVAGLAGCIRRMQRRNAEHKAAEAEPGEQGSGKLHRFQRPAPAVRAPVHHLWLFLQLRHLADGRVVLVVVRRITVQLHPVALVAGETGTDPTDALQLLFVERPCALVVGGL